MPGYSSIPREAEVNFGGQMSPAGFELVVDSCQARNYAVVRSAVSGLDLEILAREAAQFGYEDPAKPYGRMLDSGDIGGGFERRSPDIRGQNPGDLYPAVVKTFIGLIAGVNEAAERTAAARVHLKTPLQSVVLNAMTYPPGTHIGNHYDNQPGLAIVVATEGAALAQLQNPSEGHERFTEIYPGDALIMPAQVGWRGGKLDQAWHEISNITPEGGIRRSVATVFNTTVYDQRTGEFDHDRTYWNYENAGSPQQT